ncbi:MAG: hypothetical protein PHN44_08470 [Candidatus Marinimicrobia bacterium]|nr:hypothetical protein [Candidatus Neomarinimicrobiota bacterium]
MLPKEVIKVMEWNFEDEINLILDEENEVVILRNPKTQKVEKKMMMDRFDKFLETYGQNLDTLAADSESKVYQ